MDDQKLKRRFLTCSMAVLVLCPLLLGALSLTIGCYETTYHIIPAPRPPEGRVKGPITPAWESAAAGVWKARVEKPEPVTLLTTAGIEPDLPALARLGEAAFPFPESEVQCFTEDGKTFVRFPLEKGEQIFGLGLNFQTVMQRGRIMRLHVDHYGGEDNGRTHAPVPLYLSSKGYGVLIDAARYIDIYVGSAVRRDSPDHPAPRDRNTDRGWSARPDSDGVEIVVPAKGVDLYVFGGPDILRAVQRYNLYCGGGCLPPRWGLGFWHRVPTLFTEADVQEEMAAFESHEFPLDVFGLEPGWQSKAYPCSYVWDATRFPDPDAFIKRMEESGIHINLWINPYVSPESPIAEAMAPYTGSHTVWLGPVPDYTIPEACAITLGLFEKEHLARGVSGYKIDETDGYDAWLWPDSAIFPSGSTGERMRQIYGLLLQRMTADLFREHGKRTYGLTRASNAGASSLPYVLYNDSYSHHEFIIALINSGFCGILWTPEVRSSKSAEEWLRRMQSVCFSPMAMINAWSDGTKPWSFPEVFPAVREVALLRMRMIPYLYSAFARYRFEGIPPFRAMVMEPGFPATPPTDKDGPIDRKAWAEALKSQYMMGDSLLVAPMFASETERRVVLPVGNWYDFYTGDLVGNGEVITVSPGLERIPLFVKDGGIIPMMPATRSAGERPDEILLETRHYGEAEGTFILYDDDGETFAHEEGVFSRRKLEVVLSVGGSMRWSHKPPGKFGLGVHKQEGTYDSPYRIGPKRIMTSE